MIRNATYALLCAAALLAGSVSAADKPMLADRHVARGVTCQNCHPGQKPTNEVDMSTCLKCHGGSYAALAKQTESDDINPHDTHLGEAQCVTCHSGHKLPKLSCDNCHEFPDIVVPTTLPTDFERRTS